MAKRRLGRGQQPLAGEEPSPLIDRSMSQIMYVVVHTSRLDGELVSNPTGAA